MESDIIPFLSTLKGFKFGFNSGIRAEVLFINTKEVLVKWGTKSRFSSLLRAFRGNAGPRLWDVYLQGGGLRCAD